MNFQKPLNFLMFIKSAKPAARNNNCANNCSHRPQTVDAHNGTPLSALELAPLRQRKAGKSHVFLFAKSSFCLLCQYLCLITKAACSQILRNGELTQRNTREKMLTSYESEPLIIQMSSQFFSDSSAPAGCLTSCLDDSRLSVSTRWP